MRKLGPYEPQNQDNNCASISAVDLFCGVGGLTHGLVQGGIRVVAGVDLDEHCKYPYEANNEATFVQGDLRKIKSETLASMFVPNKYRLLAGCAPCQPFSTYSQKARSLKSDYKWDLLLDFGRIAKELQTELVTMENVPKLIEHSVFKKFLDCLSGYHIWYGVINCVDYGIPQTRKRLVLLASRIGPIELSPSERVYKKKLNVRNAIFKLPKLDAGEVCKSDSLHAACALSPLNTRRIKASKPGGTWRDWPVELKAECHVRVTGETYPSVYGRMKWDSPSPTITTQCFGFGNGRFGHPEQDRAITLREAAILQTFPRDYKFIPKGKAARFNILGRLIGNAVPVRLGKVVAECLMEHVRKQKKSVKNRQFAG